MKNAIRMRTLVWATMLGAGLAGCALESGYPSGTGQPDLLSEKSDLVADATVTARIPGLISAHRFRDEEGGQYDAALFAGPFAEAFIESGELREETIDGEIECDLNARECAVFGVSVSTTFEADDYWYASGSKVLVYGLGTGAEPTHHLYDAVEAMKEAGIGPVSMTPVTGAERVVFGPDNSLFCENWMGAVRASSEGAFIGDIPVERAKCGLLPHAQNFLPRPERSERSLEIVLEDDVNHGPEDQLVSFHVTGSLAEQIGALMDGGDSSLVSHIHCLTAAAFANAAGCRLEVARLSTTLFGRAEVAQLGGFSGGDGDASAELARLILAQGVPVSDTNEVRWGNFTCKTPQQGGTGSDRLTFASCRIHE